MGKVRTTKEINSVAEYLEYLRGIEFLAKRTYSVGCYTFFRGQANREWKIIPGLYRNDLFTSESLLLIELQHICPEEFLTNRFETLVKMQHFGLPTRLLDTTTNPLVALYFACKDDNEAEKDGIVYIFPNLPVMWSTNQIVDLIMDFVFEYHPSNMWVEHVADMSQQKYPLLINGLTEQNIRTLLHYYTIPAMAVMPAKTNERIEAQDGAFFIFGMKVRDTRASTNSGTFGRTYYNFDPVEITSPSNICKDAKEILIPSQAKQSILKQLDILGFNERKLFPDLEHKIQYTIQDVLANRFNGF